MISGLSTLRLSSAAIGQTKVSSRKTTSGTIKAPYLSFFIRSARRSWAFNEMVWPATVSLAIILGIVKLESGIC